MKLNRLFLSVLVILSINVFAQDADPLAGKDPAYVNVITKRAEKIVTTLDVNDSQKAKQVVAVVARQYSNLNDIYNNRDQKIAEIKTSSANKEEKDSALKNIQDNTDAQVKQLHDAYLKNLAQYLTPAQVTKVKDGMTYNVLKVTYDAYVDMIPSLTTTQKNQIMDWLVEAREHAMDGESSEKKHWWFGKYKGRINNYLSAQGYDLTKEREEWAKRRQSKSNG